MVEEAVATNDDLAAIHDEVGLGLCIGPTDGKSPKGKSASLLKSSWVFYLAKQHFLTAEDSHAAVFDHVVK